MGGMRLLQRPRVTRAAVVLPAVAVLLASSGCATVVSGTAVLSAPQVGQPVQWGPCRPAGGGSGESVAVPTGAQCGKIAVPVDYDKPDGDQAVLALIRFPATGEKIGSLIINPGGPGESGIEAAAGIVEGLPADVREPFETLLRLAVHRSLDHQQLGQPISPKKLLAFPQELRDRVFRGAVAVAVSVGRKDKDGGACVVASQWWQWRRR